LVGSQPSSRRFHEALELLGIEFEPNYIIVSDPDKPVPGPSGFTWTGHEDDKQQIAAVLAHLQEYYAPPGVKVKAVTGATWIGAELPAHVRVKRTKTGYIFLAGEFEDSYDNQPPSASASDRASLVYRGILGCAKTKRTDSLNEDFASARTQAGVEALGLYGMSSRQNLQPPFVVMGDLNDTYVFEFLPSDNKLRLAMTAAVQSHLPAAVQQIRDMLTARLDRVRKSLKTTGTGTAGSGGASVTAGPGAGSSTAGPGAGSSTAGPGAGSSTGTTSVFQAPPGNLPQASGQTGQGGSAAPALGGNQRVHSLQPYAAACLEEDGDDDDQLAAEDDDDDGLQDARAEAMFSQGIVSLLRHPVVYQSHGLSQPPTTISHISLSEWWESKRIIA
jgi:hypothetical protein